MAWLIKGALIVPVTPLAPLTGDLGDKEDKPGFSKPWFTGDIAVAADRIVAIGEDLSAELPALTAKYGELTPIPAQSFIAMPGLVNAHSHSVMNLFRGAGDDMTLEDWLFKRIFPLEDKLDGRAAAIGAASAVLEMIGSGTTCCCDSYFFMDEVAQVMLDSGIRANLGRGLTDAAGPGSGAGRLAEAEALFKKWQNAGEGRIKFWLAPHAPYTCSDEYLQEILAKAAELQVGLNIHVAETRTEFNESLAKYGMTPVERLNSLGLFDQVPRVPVLAVHCVWLTEDDRRIMKDKKVSVVHNPQSNLKLGSGIGQIPALMAAGVPVALGTDGAASNNNLDLWEEIRGAALIHKGERHNPTLMPAAQVLQMACPIGAKAIGFPECGTLAVGQKADIILIDLDQPNMRPLIDPISQLVYSAGPANVDTVMIDGRLVLRKKEFLTLDKEKILFEVQQKAEELLSGM
ncbi:MAG: amidohydrolase [Clostridiales bacterium]